MLDLQNSIITTKVVLGETGFDICNLLQNIYLCVCKNSSISTHTVGV